MQVLLPIFVCVVLPVSIVLITALRSINAENKRTKVLIKAIEANPNAMFSDKLAESLRRPVKTAREIRNGRLLRGCIFTLIGLFVAIVGIVNYATGTEFSADPVTVPLVFGGASLAVGISFLIVYFATKNQTEQ